MALRVHCLAGLPGGTAAALNYSIMCSGLLLLKLHTCHWYRLQFTYVRGCKLFFVFFPQNVEVVKLVSQMLIYQWMSIMSF